MKIRLFQLDVTPGNPASNTAVMLTAIEDARRAGIDIIVFPEMAIPGYLLSDEWERESFLNECEQAGQAIAEASTDITVVFGNIALDRERINEDGRVRKYNALFVAEDGRYLVQPKTQQPFFIKMLMPNYREFDDNRYFYDPRKITFESNLSLEDLIEPAPSRLGKLGGLLCEDGWDDDYNISPLKVLHNKGAQVFINISSSPYTHNKNHKRNRVFSAHAKSYQTPLLYCNCTGLQDNGKTLYTFDGATCAYDAAGRLLDEAAAFTQNHIDINTEQPQQSPADMVLRTDTIETQFEAITYGVKKFMQRIGLKKVVVGVSGGIDSALAAALFRHVLPPENLLLVSMPGPFTSQTTRNLSKGLADNLGCFFSEIAIAPAVDITTEQINAANFQNNEGHSFNLEVSDFVKENIQARDRSARVLAAVAAAFGGAFTCNANKSEMTVGYSTLYGDLGGFVAALADLWKGEVYDMARFINKEVYGREVIPQGSIDIVPSAELSSAQNVDAGNGDPLFYPYHDKLFRSWVERWNRATPEDNLRWYIAGKLEGEIGFEGDLQALFPTPAEFVTDLERWWNLYQGMAIAKRIQAPPVIAVKRRAFGFDHRESQLGPRYSGHYQKLKQSLLG